MSGEVSQFGLHHGAGNYFVSEEVPLEQFANTFANTFSQFMRS